MGGQEESHNEMWNITKQSNSIINIWNNLTKGNEKIVLTQVTLEMSRLYKTKNKINVMQAL